MKTRILTSIVAIPIIIIALLQPYAEVWGVIVLLAALVGLYEFYKATGINKNKSLCIMGYLGAIYFVTICFHNIAILPYSIWFSGILCLIMLFSNKTVNLTKIAVTFASTLYIPYLLSHILFLRKADNGEYYIWLILVISFLTDSCAYFVGKAFGKRKLCPNLSPNKTIAGAIGGTLGGGLFSLLFGFIVNRCFGADVNLLSIFILGLIGAIAAQLGDLTASAIKRQYNIKDYGNLFPGHGGVMDRIDSILFVAPIIYYYVGIFSRFNFGIFN